MSIPPARAQSEPSGCERGIMGWKWEQSTDERRFLGLYLYDRAGDADRAEKRARMEKLREQPILPLSTRDVGKGSGSEVFASPVSYGFNEKGAMERMGEAEPSTRML